MKLTYQKTRLANGLRVLTCAMPHTYSVGVGLYISVGSRYERRELAGAAHFIEHMLFKGTRRRPSPEAIAVEVEGRGGLFNASTGQEMTVLWVKMQQAHLALALDVLVDMLRHSLFDPGEVEKERRVILEEIISSQDIPEELVGLLVQDLMWPGHPLGWDVAGTAGSVSALGQPALRAFLAAYYGPQNTVLSVAGDVQHEQVVALATSLLGDWTPAPPGSFMPAPANGSHPRVSVVRKKVEQTHLALNLPGLARGDDDRFALSLLNVILGEGMSSRLFLEIRERLGLAYSVDSYVSLLSDTGVVGIYAAVAPVRAVEALSAILGQLDRLRNEAVDATTLKRAREAVKGRLLMSMEDTLAVASWFGRQEALGFDVLTVEEVIGRMEVVTAADLQRVAQRVFRPDGAALAVVGPHKRAEGARLEALMAR